MIRHKLLVLDIDGTLLDNRHRVSSGTVNALFRVQQVGIRLVLASGRPLHGLLPIAQRLELPQYDGCVMAYNGGLILNCKTGEFLFDRKLDIKILPFLYKEAKKKGFPIFTYKDDVILTDTPDNAHIEAEAALNGMRIEKVDNFGEAIDFPPYKCVLVSDDMVALEELANDWKRHLNGAADVFLSEDYFLEVAPPAVNKGNALSIIKDARRVETEKVIAIGDGVCDIPMLQLAGLGIAMGNANATVQFCADETTSSNEEEGVANAIEKYILSDIRAAEIPLDGLNSGCTNTLMDNLGIVYTYANLQEQVIEATMPVNERTRQPFGILHGGATLALAETVAGLGSMLICKPNEIVVGMQVSGNHMSSAQEGDTVRAIAKLLHKGRSSHVWDVNIYTTNDKLVSAIRVVNGIVKKR